MPSVKASKNPTDKPTKAEKQALKTSLKALGLKQKDVDEILTSADENNATLDARAIEGKLRGWLAKAPKGA